MGVGRCRENGALTEKKKVMEKRSAFIVAETIGGSEVVVSDQLGSRVGGMCSWPSNAKLSRRQDLVVNLKERAVRLFYSHKVMFELDAFTGCVPFHFDVLDRIRYAKGNICLTQIFFFFFFLNTCLVSELY